MHNKSFLQDTSARYLEMAYRTDKRECSKNPDGYGKRTGRCGDTIEIFLTVSDKRIQTVSFDIDGCLNTNACANTVVLLAEGKTIEQAWKIMPEDVVDYLGILPPEDTHCAELAAGALYLALSDFQKMKQNPWKKMYKNIR